MINFNDITKGAKSDIEESSYFKGYKIEIGAPMNVDPGINWIGIYRDRVSYEPYTLAANTWKAIISLKLFIQDIKYLHNTMDDKLEEKIEALLSAIDTNKRTLGNTVNRVVGYDIAYSFVDNDASSFYFQTAIITIQAEKVNV